MESSKFSGFRFFPPERLFSEYPFGIWFAGCILISKGILWLFMSNTMPAMYLFPLLIAAGFGVWNFRVWGKWLGIFVVLSDLCIYWFLPYSPFGDPSTGLHFDSASAIVNLVIGPICDIIVLGLLIFEQSIKKKNRKK